MVENITSLQDTRVSFFCALTESQLRNRLEPEQGIFIAESPKVILVALSAGYEPIALLCEERHIKGAAAKILNSDVLRERQHYLLLQEPRLIYPPFLPMPVELLSYME